MLREMLGVLERRTVGTVGEEELTFRIDRPSFAAAEIVRSMDGSIGTRIGRYRNVYVYVLGDGAGFGGAEVKAMRLAKHDVIEVLSSQKGFVRQKHFDYARQIAKESLSKLVDGRKVDLLASVVAHDTAGYGPLSMLMEHKERIEEIEVSSLKDPITVYDSEYGRCMTNLHFNSEQGFRNDINRFIEDQERELGENSPVIDVQVPGARVHAQAAPYAANGAMASIRLSAEKRIGFQSLIKSNTLSFDLLAYLWMAVDSRCNIVVSGAPASGKTTLVNCLVRMMPDHMKKVIIEEDVNEIKADYTFSNMVSLYGTKHGKVTPKEQVINALRMRPDWIIVGEVRGDEANHMFMGANVGVPFIATMHSNEGGMEIVTRLLLKPMSVDLRGVSMLDVSIYMKQTGIGERRVSGIFEYRWLSRAQCERGIEIEGREALSMQRICTDGVLNKHALQASKVMEAYASANGLSVAYAIRELEARSRLLQESSASEERIIDAMQAYIG